MHKLKDKAALQLQDSISRLVNRPVHLTITDNTHSMLHFRHSRAGYRLRLHHMFLHADGKILESLASYIEGRSGKPPSSLREFVRTNSHRIRKVSPRPRRTVLRTAGRFFDLKEIYDQVNQEYFDNRIECRITWGAKRRVRAQNSIKLGTYSEATGTIRINPALDKSYVPKYVIKGIVYHEMLHHYLGVKFLNGRKIAHSKNFRQLESQYRHYRKLQKWKKNHLERLFGRRRWKGEEL